MTPPHNDQPEILVLDGNERNADLLSDFLVTEGYEEVVVTDLCAAGEVITDASRFTFAIVDIDRFEQPVWPYCERLNNHNVPFIVLSGLRNRTLRQESHHHGANAFVDKPIPKRELRNLIQSAVDPW